MTHFYIKTAIQNSRFHPDSDRRHSQHEQKLQKKRKKCHENLENRSTEVGTAERRRDNDIGINGAEGHARANRTRPGKLSHLLPRDVFVRRILDNLLLISGHGPVGVPHTRLVRAGRAVGAAQPRAVELPVSLEGNEHTQASTARVTAAEANGGTAPQWQVLLMVHLGGHDGLENGLRRLAVEHVADHMPGHKELVARRARGPVTRRRLRVARVRH